MSFSQTLPNRKYSTADAKSSDSSGDTFSHRIQSEATRFAIIAVLVFVAAVILPTGNWLERALDYQAYHLDDIIVAVFVVSFVLLAFLFRGWQAVRQEARERALAVKQMEQRSRIDAQLGQMTSLLHACFALEEASTIISHFSCQLFPVSFSFVTTASVLRLNIARKFLVCSTNWIRAAKAQALVSRSYGELSNFMEAKFGWRVRQGKALHFASRLERAPTQAENLKVLPACFRHSRFLGRFIWV